MMECSDNALSSALIKWKRAESQENCVTVGTPAMMNWQPSPKMMFQFQVSRFRCQLPIPDAMIGMKCALCSRMNVLTGV